MPKEICRLYRYKWITELGYVVYRYPFHLPLLDYKGQPSDDKIRQQRVAVFVQEDAAWDYCRHRNTLVEANDDDALDDVRIYHPGEHLSVTQGAKTQSAFTRRRPVYRVFFEIGEDGEPRHSAGVKPTRETMEKVRRHVFYGGVR